MATAAQTAAARKQNIQPGYDVVVTTAFELIGIGLLALLAGVSDNMGKIVIIVMSGFLIGWLLLNTGVLEKYLGNPVGIDPIFGKYTKGMKLWAIISGRCLPSFSWELSSSR